MRKRGRNRRRRARKLEILPTIGEDMEWFDTDQETSNEGRKHTDPVGAAYGDVRCIGSANGLGHNATNRLTADRTTHTDYKAIRKENKSNNGTDKTDRKHSEDEIQDQTDSEIPTRPEGQRQLLQQPYQGARSGQLDSAGFSGRVVGAAWQGLPRNQGRGISKPLAESAADGDVLGQGCGKCTCTAGTRSRWGSMQTRMSDAPSSNASHDGEPQAWGAADGDVPGQRGSLGQIIVKSHDSAPHTRGAADGNVPGKRGAQRDLSACVGKNEPDTWSQRCRVRGERCRWQRFPRPRRSEISGKALRFLGNADDHHP